MAIPTLDEQIHEIVQNLSEDEKQKLLAFAELLGKHHQPIGEPAENLTPFIGLFDEEALNQMQAAIEEDCEQIDWENWK